MSISPERQIFMCFVCHHGGNVFTFLKDYLKIPYIEAVKMVANIGNVDISKYNLESRVKPVDQKLEPLYRMHDEANKIYNHYLNTKLAIQAKEYLNNRKITDEIIETFEIGYATNNHVLLKAFEKMNFNNNPYVFLVATYRGHPGDIGKRLDDLLKTRKAALSLNVGVSMPGNSYLSTVEQIKDTLANQKTNIKKLVKSIIEQDKIDYSLLPEVENSAVYKACNMRGIKVDEKCIGCQTCIKVCPMNNIELIEGKIKIKDNCMTCLACFHWCPTAAIYMSKEKEIERREKYHHPDVRLTDIIKQKYNEFVE